MRRDLRNTYLPTVITYLESRLFLNVETTFQKSQSQIDESQRFARHDMTFSYSKESNCRLSLVSTVALRHIIKDRRILLDCLTIMFFTAHCRFCSKSYSFFQFGFILCPACIEQNFKSRFGSAHLPFILILIIRVRHFCRFEEITWSWFEIHNLPGRQDISILIC